MYVPSFSTFKSSNFLKYARQFSMKQNQKMTHMTKEHSKWPCALVYYYICNQWHTQEFFLGGGSTNSVEDRENEDLGVVAP